jgi:hypothetical protein
MKFRTKMLEALRNDAEAAAHAIDEAQQQLNVLYESIRDAHARGVLHGSRARTSNRACPCDTAESRRRGQPPIRPTIDLR